MARAGEMLTDNSGVTSRVFTSLETANAWVMGAEAST
jgi:hypothetical protein